MSRVSELLGRVEEWLERERSHFVSVAAAKGLPLSVEADAPVASMETGPRRFEVRDEVRSHSGIDLATLHLWSEDDGAERRWRDAKEIAGFLAELGEKLDTSFRGVSHLYQGGDGEEPSVEMRLLAACVVEYLSNLTSLDNSDTQLAARLALELIEYLTAQHEVGTERSFMAGLSLENGATQSSSVAPRAGADTKLNWRVPTEQEAGRLLQALHGNQFTPEVTREFDHAYPSLVLDVRTAVGRPCALMPDSGGTTMATGLALQLLGYQPSAVGAVVRRSEPTWVFPGNASSRSSLPTSSVDHIVYLSTANLDTVESLVVELSRFNLRNPKAGLELALHRFHLGCAREPVVDALLDFVIALEIILLPGMQGEVTYRFGINGALWIGGLAGVEPIGIVKNLRSIYGLRSTIVHGGILPGMEAIRKALGDAREYARLSLLRATRDGSPDQKWFEEAVLGVAERSSRDS